MAIKTRTSRVENTLGQPLKGIRFKVYNGFTNALVGEYFTKDDGSVVIEHEASSLVSVYDGNTMIKRINANLLPSKFVYDKAQSSPNQNSGTTYGPGTGINPGANTTELSKRVRTVDVLGEIAPFVNVIFANGTGVMTDIDGFATIEANSQEDIITFSQSTGVKRYTFKDLPSVVEIERLNLDEVVLVKDNRPWWKRNLGWIALAVGVGAIALPTQPKPLKVKL